jgi:hypothetical protein
MFMLNNMKAPIINPPPYKSLLKPSTTNICGLIFMVALFLFANLSTAFATGSASLSFSPASEKVDAGKDLVLKVHLNTGDQPVNAIQADISYPLNIFDPTQSSIKCIDPFPTNAQEDVKGTINTKGAQKGLVKAACAIALGNGQPAPFNGEADIALLTLHVRPNAPAVHSSTMLEFAIDKTHSAGHEMYSQVASSTTNNNVLGNVSSADVTINAKAKPSNNLDINGDNKVDSSDIASLISNFNKSPTTKNEQSSDINGDKEINTIDLSILLSSLL